MNTLGGSYLHLNLVHSYGDTCFRCGQQASSSKWDVTWHEGSNTKYYPKLSPTQSGEMRHFTPTPTPIPPTPALCLVRPPYLLDTLL